MIDSMNMDRPMIHGEIEKKCEEIGFDMPSDMYIGSLLKTLIASKPHSNLLELGTGIGLSLSWMIDGMDSQSTLTTIDNDALLISIVTNFFKQDNRVQIICIDGAEWIRTYKGEKFDLIFADAWPGKYSEIDEILALVKIGGFYVIDDMLAQPNWPAGHQDKVDNLIKYLENRSDFNITKMNWSSGIIICTRKES
jgi:predicted O-methyltransferase YrrM